MTNGRAKNDGIDALLQRLGKATDQLTKASEKQAREIDRQLKRLIDRGEASTERMLKRIDKELGVQIEAMRRQLRDLERRVGQLGESKAKSTTAKQAAPRTSAAKKTPAKKTTAKKTTAKRTPAKKAESG